MEELSRGESRRLLGGCRRSGAENVAVEGVGQKRWLQKEWGIKGGCGRDRWESKSRKRRRFSKEEVLEKEKRKRKKQKGRGLSLRGLRGKRHSLAGCLRGRIAV